MDNPMEDEGTIENEYELTPEGATGFRAPPENPGVFNRKRALLALCVAFAVVAGGGFLFNARRGGGRDSAGPASATAARTPTDFLRGQYNRSLSNAAQDNAAGGMGERAGPVEQNNVEAPGEPPLPAAAWGGGPAAGLVTPQYPPPQAPTGQGSTVPAPGNTAPQGPPPLPSHFLSPLTPRVEGSVFGGGPAGPAAQAAPPNPMDAYMRYAMAAQTPPAQAPPPAGDAGVEGGRFIPANSLWVGTIIPGVLLTAVSTDLPGNVIARVTENVYDSQTGKSLLVPQGTILVARYNNSVSYAQKRVQIAWDTLVRPDGFELELGGMGGVDRRGMSGQEAQYSENWFEYLKAAGLIALFTVANSKVADSASRYSSEAVAGGIAQANAEFVSQVGGSIVSRAMDVQPTLTVDSGTVINILLNKNLYLPPLDGPPVLKKYTLE